LGVLSWIICGLIAGGLARRAVGAQKRGCLGTILVGVLGALLAGAVYRLITGDEMDTFNELDLGSIFVAFIGAGALLLIIEAVSGPEGRRWR
jgi:uncharacterized membrane protein YeaQ/YmgE (transglycosylase-associated protein family)